jgi:dTDP-4-dehydrorhamnose reductase
MSNTSSAPDRRILITGATGLLCQDLLPALSRNFTCFPTGFSRALDHPNFHQANLLNYEDVSKLLEQTNPDTIIHCAALADVDRCEEAPHKAHELTVQTTKNLTRWIAENAPEMRLIYVSSDQVYAGDGPHSENSVSPRNVYALTKLWAEDIARTAKWHLVLRLNFFGLGAEGSGGFANWLIESFKTGENITLFEDVYFNPLYSKDLADMISHMLCTEVTGTYNLGADGGGMSKSEFANLLASSLNLSTENAVIGKIDDLSLKAWRPRDMRTSVDKLTQVIERPLPTIRDGIERLAQEFIEKTRSNVQVEAK